MHGTQFIIGVNIYEEHRELQLLELNTTVVSLEKLNEQTKNSASVKIFVIFCYFCSLFRKNEGTVRYSCAFCAGVTFVLYMFMDYIIIFCLFFNRVMLYE